MTHRRCADCDRPFEQSRSGQRFCSRTCQVRGGHRTPALAPITDHVFIPDTQCKDGVPDNHLVWVGRYIRDKYLTSDKRLVVIHGGDHWDMPSLSSWDKGTRRIEGRRIKADIDAGSRGFRLLNDAIGDDVAGDYHFLDGNHEDRVTRATNSNPQLDGLVSLDDMDVCGWQRHAFLVPVTLDGVMYSHYFANPMTGRPYAGNNIETRLKSIGGSFSMGHQQTLLIGMRYTAAGVQQNGLVAGACYLHDEDYKGPQGNAHWRGIVVCHNVHQGSYDVKPVSLDSLCRRYEGVPLAEFRRSL